MPPARTKEAVPSYDPVRTLRFVAFGTFMGPILARWNHFLEHRFPLRPSSLTPPAATPKPGAGDGRTAQSVQNATGPVASRGNVSLTALTKRVGMDQTIMAPLGVGGLPYLRSIHRQLTFSIPPPLPPPHGFFFFPPPFSILVDDLPRLDGRDGGPLPPRHPDQIRRPLSTGHNSELVRLAYYPIHQLPLHAVAVSGTVPGDVWRFLDALSIPPQLK